MIRRHAYCPWLLAVGILYCLACPAKGEGKRIALVVGVQKYSHSSFKDLDFPNQDAAELAQILNESGFDKVVLMNADQAHSDLRPTFANITREFEKALEGIDKRDVLLVALSGHGVENDKRENFFCPVDANPFTYKQCLPLQPLLNQMYQSGVGSSLLLVDACRDEVKLPRGAKGACRHQPSARKLTRTLISNLNDLTNLRSDR